jgi:SAM-dependent methyltransferase
MLDRFNRWLIFNLWYFSRPPWNTEISPSELINFIHSHPPGLALDLGCGTGFNSLTLAQAGWQVIGIDFALRAVFIARQRLSKAGIQRAKFMVEDVTRPDHWNGPFDLILDIGCLHGLADEGKLAYLKNLYGLLAPRGYFLLYAHLKSSPSKSVGLSDREIGCLGSRLNQLERTDGFERNQKSSAWFLYQKE